MRESNYGMPENLYKYAIGEMAVEYVETLRPDELLPAVVESAAMGLLDEIRAILEGGTMEDADCFRQVQEIIEAFTARGMAVAGRDW